MKKDDFFYFNGETAPFGDGNEYKVTSDLNVTCRCEKGYKKLCKECKSATPESMKGFIAEDVCDEDEIYYCYWCDFIRATGIDESLMQQNQKKTDALESHDEDYESEDDGSDAMWELEDAGAFSDEGIMPGCHSRDWEYEWEAREIAKEFEDMAFVGNLLKTARDKIQLSVEELAKRLKLPESFILDLESGKYINRYGKQSVADVFTMVTPVAVVDPEVKKEENRVWWQECSDSEIREKIADYLIYGKLK